jgi:hypothetical protein
VIHNDGKKLKKKNPNMWWLVAGKVLARPHPSQGSIFLFSQNGGG